LWCAGFRVVQVPPAATPKDVTLVMPYYENPQFFARQLAFWAAYPPDVKAHLRVIVVDDGSPEPIHMPPTPPLPLRVFRIEKDVRWNWLAARNIGAHHAPEGWLLMTDMDHVVPPETARGLIDGAHRPDIVYAFARREHTGEVIAPHSASFLMTRAMFWAIGGYDERFSGFYGTDGRYRRRLATVARIHLLPDALIRHERVADASTVRYKRKQPEDAEVRRIAARLSPHAKPQTLSFKYHEVTA
jgi:GT2 family glycosyltransferase